MRLLLIIIMNMLKKGMFFLLLCGEKGMLEKKIEMDTCEKGKNESDKENHRR